MLRTSKLKNFYNPSDSEVFINTFILITETMKNIGLFRKIRRSCSTGHIVGGGEPSYSYKDEKYDDFDRFISNLLNAD
jgi:hypothetical protein